MAIHVHHKGDVVRVTAEFEDENGAAIDPTTIALKVMDPSGNVDTYTFALGQITKAAIGSYYKDLDADEEGDWHVWWLSTGSGQAAEPNEFVVAPTPF